MLGDDGVPDALPEPDLKSKPCARELSGCRRANSCTDLVNGPSARAPFHHFRETKKLSRRSESSRMSGKTTPGQRPGVVVVAHPVQVAPSSVT